MAGIASASVICGSFRSIADIGAEAQDRREIEHDEKDKKDSALAVYVK